MESEIAKYSIARKISESCGRIKLAAFFTNLQNFFSLRNDRIFSILKRVHPKISIVSFIPQMVKFADEVVIRKFSHIIKNVDIRLLTGAFENQKTSLAAEIIVEEYRISHYIRQKVLLPEYSEIVARKFCQLAEKDIFWRTMSAQYFIKNNNLQNFTDILGEEEKIELEKIIYVLTPKCGGIILSKK